MEKEIHALMIWTKTELIIFFEPKKNRLPSSYASNHFAQEPY